MRKFSQEGREKNRLAYTSVHDRIFISNFDASERRLDYAHNAGCVDKGAPARCTTISGTGCSRTSLVQSFMLLRRTHSLQHAGYASRSVIQASPGTTTAEEERIKALEREVRELRKANGILRLASAFFAQAELGRHFKP
jgi:hypothetical protein